MGVALVGLVALQLAGAVLLTLDLPPALGLLDDAVGGVVGLLSWCRGAWEAPCATWPRCWLVGVGLDAVTSGVLWEAPDRAAAGDRRRHLP
jgi:hypothetical protein